MALSGTIAAHRVGPLLGEGAGALAASSRRWPERVPPLALVAPRTLPLLWNLVERNLAAEPTRRSHAAAELAADLAKIGPEA